MLAGLALPATAAADRTYNILPPGQFGGAVSHKRYCDRGSLTRCRAALWSALAKATAGLPDGARSDATKERIERQPGLVVKDTMRWTNRPTFQQVLELAHP